LIYRIYRQKSHHALPRPRQSIYRVYFDRVCSSKRGGSAVTAIVVGLLFVLALFTAPFLAAQFIVRFLLSAGIAAASEPTCGAFLQVASGNTHNPGLLFLIE